MRLHDPYRGQGFEAFRRDLKPHIRPEGHLEQLQTAFGVDVAFHAEFRLLRPFLRAAQKDWAERILMHLLRHDGVRRAVRSGGAGTLAALYDRHARLFAEGGFDAAYLDSVEDVALFFLYQEARSVWLAGIYGALEQEAVDGIFEAAKRQRQLPLRRLMRSLSVGMTIELSQIQRVFITYERHLADLAFQGRSAPLLGPGAPCAEAPPLS